MKISQVAVQLYTLRDFCQTAEALADTARKVRAIGYESVQVSGIGPIAPAEVRGIFEAAGLTICATHESGEVLRKDVGKAIENLRAYGATLTAYPYPAGVDFSSAADVDSLISDLDRSGAVMREAGLRLGYHNHGTEFAKVGASTLLDLIRERTAPENLFFELDTYWVQYGGCNPVDWIRKVHGRLPAIHMKDYGFSSTTNQPVFAEIGSGNLDFPAIVRAAEDAGCQWFIVEQDSCPGDPFESIRKSFDYIAAELVS